MQCSRVAGNNGLQSFETLLKLSLDVVCYQIINRNVKQHIGEHRREWFRNDYFDLIVWYNQDNSIYGFQLCYDIYGMEHAVTWLENGGFFHNEVDGGDTHTGISKTPVLIADGEFPYRKVIDRYLADFPDIKEKNSIFLFVYDKLLEYSNSNFLS